MSDWSDLPTELLEKIWNCLRSTHSDTLQFRSIFRSWRSSAPLLRATNSFSKTDRGNHSQVTFTNAPPLYGFPASDGDGTCVFPKVINLLDFEVIELCIHNCLSGSYEDNKLAFASGHHSKSDDGCITVLGVDNVDGELGVWRTGDERWTFFSDPTIKDLRFISVLFIHNKFNAIDHDGSIVTIDPDSLKVLQVSNKEF
ncbi:hypothetical protein Tsubulata_006484 [Turnera subulata]|uniref:F-box domain-containing protein n=1 Tax=Turnera subulata TaxID=218843 RepID=A0A9Q0JIS1_9ROSI|nr:hypothetical protein Tsubulata_006484 [Turnera subulata]